MSHQADEGLLQKLWNGVRRYLFGQFLAYLLPLVGAVEAVASIFNMSPCQSRLLLTGTAALGGLAILVLSLTDSHRDRYKHWDRGLTLMSLLIVTGVLVWLTFKVCPPPSTLTASPTPTSPLTETNTPTATFADTPTATAESTSPSTSLPHPTDGIGLIIIFADKDSLTVYIPADVTSPLQDLNLEYRTSTGTDEEYYFNKDFAYYVESKVSPPFCLRLEQANGGAPFPSECRSVHHPITRLPAGDIFWWDEFQRNTKSMFVNLGDERLGICNSGFKRCPISVP